MSDRKIGRKIGMRTGETLIIVVDAVWNGEEGTWEATCADLPDLDVSAPTYDVLLDRLQADALFHTRPLLAKGGGDIMIDVVRNRSATLH